MELPPHAFEGHGLIDRRWGKKRPKKNKQSSGAEQASQDGEKLESGPAVTPVVMKNEIVLFQGEGKICALQSSHGSGEMPIRKRIAERSSGFCLSNTAPIPMVESWIGITRFCARCFFACLPRPPTISR